MALNRSGFAHHHNRHILSLPHIFEPAIEHPRPAHALAAPNFVRVEQGLLQLRQKFGQQIEWG